MARTNTALQTVPNHAPQECICPNHIVDPAQMCQKHQAEYIAYLDEQAELDTIQQQYEAQIDR